MNEEVESLGFDQLRAANLARLPLFKNSKGETAHSKPDGSDWTPADWFEAFIGEVGELARERANLEEGKIGWAQYRFDVEKELADVQTYLDMMSARMLDATLGAPTRSTHLMHCVASLGEYANESKKFRRGDVKDVHFANSRRTMLERAEVLLVRVMGLGLNAAPTDAHVVKPHPTGVNLGRATANKFNEVSKRIGCDVALPEPWSDDSPTTIG